MTLDIKLFSFSLKYRDTFPDDLARPTTVIDCRGVENPGRHPAMGMLTGADMPVQAFMDSNASAQAFLAALDVVLLAGKDKFLSGAYGNLIVGFGCTGGQHRSVYFAEKTAEKFRARFSGEDIQITVQHLDISSHYGADISAV